MKMTNIKIAHAIKQKAINAIDSGSETGSYGVTLIYGIKDALDAKDRELEEKTKKLIQTLEHYATPGIHECWRAEEVLTDFKKESKYYEY